MASSRRLSAELERLREQKPVCGVIVTDDGESWPQFYRESGGVLWDLPVGDHKLFAAPVPAVAVPTNTIPEGDDFNGTTPHMIRCIEALVAMNDRGALTPHGLCRHSRTLLLASANRLRQQQAQHD